MHAVPRAMAQALEEAGRAHPPRRRRPGGPAPLRRRGGRRRRPPTASSVAADAVVCTVDLPVAYDRLLPGVAAPRTVRAGDYSPSAVVWHVGASGRPADARPPPQHPLRRRLGRRVRRDHRPRRADARPVAPRHRADACPTRPPHPTARPPSTCWSRCRTPAPGSTGGASPARCASASTRSSRPAATPTDVRRGAAGDARRLARPGHAPRHAVRPGAHVPAVRALPPVERRPPRCPGWSSPGREPQPGVGIPMVLVSGKLAAQRVQEYAGDARPVPRVVR